MRTDLKRNWFALRMLAVGALALSLVLSSCKKEAAVQAQVTVAGRAAGTRRDL